MFGVAGNDCPGVPAGFLDPDLGVEVGRGDMRVRGGVEVGGPPSTGAVVRGEALLGFLLQGGVRAAEVDMMVQDV